MLSHKKVKIKIILSLLFLICFEKVKSQKENNFNNYYFTIYPSKNSETPYVLIANTPFSEELKIDFNQSNTENFIQNCHSSRI